MENKAIDTKVFSTLKYLDLKIIELKTEIDKIYDLIFFFFEKLTALVM